MIYQPESFYSTTLAASITAAQTSIGVTVAPNITSGYLVIEANTSNREIIKYTGVTGTTLTGCVRGLATYGSDNSGGTGKTHSAGVEIANKDVHYYYAQYYDFLMGTSATGANTMRIGDGAAVSSANRFWYVNTSSVSAFWGLNSSGQMVVSENGVTSYVISAGGSGVTAGDGISITAGAVAIKHLSSSGLRISATKLAVNYGQGLSATSAAELYVDLTHNYDWTGRHTFAASSTFNSSADFKSAVNLSGLTKVSTEIPTVAGQVVGLDSGAKLPAVDGSQLTNLTVWHSANNTQVLVNGNLSAWTDVSLSAWVGANTALVMLIGAITDTADGSRGLAVRRNGDTTDYVHTALRGGTNVLYGAAGSYTAYGLLMVPTDSSGIIEYSTNGGNNQAQLYLLGYIK